MKSKVGFRNWISFILAGLIGQFAWTIENMYLNRYLYALDASKLNYVSLMVALSAAVATITTLLMGALSDRLGKRKLFISLGYIIWGITIVIFGILKYNFVTHAALLVVIMDCVMTFFGSTANDASFNAFVTDNTNTNNRGKVESVLSILPLVSMLFIVGVMEPLLISKGKWDIFFYIFGGLILVVGIILVFVLPKDKVEPNTKEPYIKNIFYGFRPSTIKKNPMLYIVLTAFMLFNMAIQVFFPYFMIYIQYGTPSLQGMDFVVVLGVVLLLACIITVVFGLFMDKIGKNKIMIPSLIFTIIGCILMFFFVDKIGIMISGTILMAGYMVSTAVLGAKVRDYTPDDEVGLFQGIRMVFAVLVPMVTGPYIGELCYHINKQVTDFTNEYGVTVTGVVPNKNIFIGAAIVLVLAIIPIIFLIIKEKKNISNNEEKILETKEN